MYGAAKTMKCHYFEENKKNFLLLWSDISGFIFDTMQIKHIEKITQTTCPKYRQEMDCTRHLVGQLLAEYGVFRYYLQHLSNPFIPMINQQKGQKPAFENGVGIEFNISHSHEIVVCAFSYSNIGADVEYVEHDILPIAERFFKPEEKALISHSMKPNETAYKIWVRKESYLKTIGKGIGYINEIPSVVNGSSFVTDIDGYCFHEIEIKHGYQMIVCAEKTISSSLTKEVNVNCLIRFLKEI